MMPTTSLPIAQTCGHSQMDFHEAKTSLDASAWMRLGRKAPLHYEGLDTEVQIDLTASASSINNHVCTANKDPEGTMMRQFIGTIQNSPTPDMFPRKPYASGAIDVGDYRDGNFTGKHISQADGIESEVLLAEAVPPEAVPTPSPSSKDDL